MKVDDGRDLKKYAFVSQLIKKLKFSSSGQDSCLLSNPRLSGTIFNIGSEVELHGPPGIIFNTGSKVEPPRPPGIISLESQVEPLSLTITIRTICFFKGVQTPDQPLPGGRYIKYFSS